MDNSGVLGAADLVAATLRADGDSMRRLLRAGVDATRALASVASDHGLSMPAAQALTQKILESLPTGVPASLAPRLAAVKPQAPRPDLAADLLQAALANDGPRVADLRMAGAPLPKPAILARFSPQIQEVALAFGDVRQADIAGLANAGVALPAIYRVLGRQGHTQLERTLQATGMLDGMSPVERGAQLQGMLPQANQAQHATPGEPRHPLDIPPAPRGAGH